MEILKNLWKKNRSNESQNPFPEDLKKFIVERQDVKKRIKGLEMDMDLVASARDQGYSFDRILLNELRTSDEKLAKNIFDLCRIQKIDPLRFLSAEEFDQFSSGNVERKVA